MCLGSQDKWQSQVSHPGLLAPKEVPSLLQCLPLSSSTEASPGLLPPGGCPSPRLLTAPASPGPSPGGRACLPILSHVTPPLMTVSVLNFSFQPTHPLPRTF